MKSLMRFLQYVLDDLGTWCRTSTIRDLKTITKRIEDEGISFLTISLSNFGTDFQKSLDQGFVGHDQFVGFKRTGGLPRLFGGFLDLVFDRKTGRLLDTPSIEAIHAIRQITLMWAKIALPCTTARERAAINKYVETERHVREAHDQIDSAAWQRFDRLGTLLWADIFTAVDYSVFYGEIVPRHGPGATADRLRGNRKWEQQEWTERLERVFPHFEYLTSSWSLSYDRLTDVRILDPGAERPVRVITVPKTLKTPRIIAVEPTCMQYMQQGLLARIEDEVGRDELAYHFIDWKSQVPNQHLARDGSKDQSLATLDLSEASDRVSNQQVRRLLRNHPHLLEAVDATRSRKADVPGHGVIRLAKFASMGSALCFPFESMVFLTVIFSGIERELRRPLSRKDIKSFTGRVRVYGDDIIVPVQFVRAVVEELETFGFLVNSSKSYWTGKFRESCGRDYYDGVDVSIVRLRSLFPTRRQHASEIVSTVSTRNQLYKAGLWRAAGYLDNLLEGIIPFPIVEETSEVLGRVSFLGLEEPVRMHPNLHKPLVYGMKVSTVIPKDILDDYGALLKCLTQLDHKYRSGLQPGDLPITGVGHLERAGRPRAVDIKPRWGSPW